MNPRLYLDEDVLPELAGQLRRQGYDVLSAQELGHRGWSDEEQLEWAAANDRAILSFNYRDFQILFRRWFEQGRTHSGIIVAYRQYSEDELGELVRLVSTLLGKLTLEQLTGTIWSVTQEIDA